jgi:hypothetical protein
MFVSVWFVVGSFCVHSVSPPPQLLAWVRELQPQLPVALLFTSYRLSVPASVNRGRNATAGLVVYVRSTLYFPSFFFFFGGFCVPSTSALHFVPVRAPFSIITINSPVGVH